MRIVIDTNILVSAIIKDSTTRQLLLRLCADFYMPRACIEELLKHKDLIIKKGNISDETFKYVFLDLLKTIKIVQDKDIEQCISEANRLLGNIDADDVVFLATAISIKAEFIWSNDKDFKMQSLIRAITTGELIRLLSKRWEL